MSSSPLAASELDAFCGQGLALHQAGRLDEARQVYEAVLSAEPAHVQALHLLGVFCIQTGRLDQGAALIGRALDIRPDDVAALGNLATALNGLGRHEEALARSERAIALQPGDVAAHGNRGQALQALGRLDEALQSYDRAADLNPGQAKAHFNRGVVLQALGRQAEALEAFMRAIALDPGMADAHRRAGMALRALGRAPEALASYDTALALRPNQAEAHCARGNLLCELKRYVEALEAYDRALAFNPEMAEAWLNRVVALRGLRRLPEALQSAQRALELDPESADAHNKHGSALYDLERLDEALDSLDRAIALDPAHPQARLNRGVLLLQQRRFPEAMAELEQARLLRPEDPNVNLHQAMLRLMLGDDAEGWPQYEWRWRAQQFEQMLPTFPMPLWLGKEDLRGRSILVHAEQGLGDVLQFCRHVPALSAMGAKVVYATFSPLVRLSRRLAAGEDITVISDSDRQPVCDFHVLLMSLPLALGAGLHDPCGPYLSPYPEDVAAWAKRLAGTKGLRVGLCWGGAPRQDDAAAYATDLRRSVPLAAFRPLADLPGVAFFSLQKGPAAAQLPVAEDWPTPIIDFTDELNDFADTAALAANLDLVIACDTSTAHVAAAIGRPVWVLNRFDACWRWGADCNDAPEYPTIRLFRQEQPGDWAGVMVEVKAALAELAGA